MRGQVKSKADFWAPMRSEMQVEFSSGMTVSIDETNAQTLFPELLAVIDEIVDCPTSMRTRQSRVSGQGKIVLEVLDPGDHRSVEISVPADDEEGGYMVRGFWKLGSLPPREFDCESELGEHVLTFLTER